MLFLNMLCVMARSLQLRDIKELSGIEKNCTSNQKFIDNKQGVLVNLVGIFRHGDRAPLSIQNKAWKAKSCIECADSCKSQPCSDGMLTKKGYIQSKKLGKFIKKFYLPKFKNISDISGYHSKIERSITTLHGVVAGLDQNMNLIVQEDSIVSGQNIAMLKSQILKDEMKKIRRPPVHNYRIYDEIIASYCSDMPFQCSGFTCRPEKIFSFVEDQQNDFIEVANLVKTTPITMGIALGKLGVFLKERMARDETITLVSGHDSTIIKVLSGLNIPISEFPGYTSAIFIEVWKHPDNRKYVRIVYQGRPQRFGLYSEDYVDFDNFMRYLSMFAKTNQKITGFLEMESEKTVSIDRVKEIAINAERAYKSLIKELEKNNLFVGYEKDVQDVETTSLEEEDEVSKQFLFGKKPEKYQVKVQVEDGGKTETRILECEKGKDGKCKDVTATSKKTSDKKKSGDSTNKDKSESNCDSKCDEKCNKCDSKCDQKCNKCDSKCDQKITKGCDKKTACDSCKREFDTCTPSNKATSAFDGLPGSCKMFDNRDCEYFKKQNNPCNQQEDKNAVNVSKCGSVSPGVWIVQ